MIFQKETKRLMRKLVIAGAALLAVYGANLNKAYADEENGDTYIIIDEMTGKPVDNSSSVIDNEGEETSNIIKIDDNCTYDPTTEYFTFSISDLGGELFKSTIGNGGITTQSVKLIMNSAVDSKLYCDGVEMEEIPDEITKPGSYTMKLYGMNGQSFIPLKFTIIGVKTNINSVSVAGVYSMESALINDELCKITGDTLDMSAEGTYVIYVTNIVSEISYKVETEVIHTPPSIKLEAVNENNLARGPVDISDIDKDWDVVIYLNNKEIEKKEILEDSGNYSITLKDKAGNVTNYSFTILLYINNIGMVLILVIFLLVAGLFIYLIILRKKKKVR